MLYDVERIQLSLKYSGMKELYSPSDFDEIKKKIQTEALSRNKCVLELQQILANYKVAHLGINPLDPDDFYTEVSPLSFRCFGNDYYVVETTPEYEPFLNYKLVGLGDFNVEEVKQRLCSFNGFETETGKKYKLEHRWNYKQLEHVGLLNSKGYADFVLQAPNGTFKTVSCKAINPYKTNTYKEDTNYTLEFKPENGFVYFQYFSCFDNEDYSFKDMIEIILKETAEHEYHTIIFDLRYNGGGNSGVANYPIYLYREELNKFNIAIVISGRTYSAACQFLDCCLNYLDKVIFFGEETGQAVKNYTNVNTIELNNLHCKFYFPNVLDSVPQLEKRSKDISKGTQPDVYLSEDFVTYKKGEDSIYNGIKEYYGF